MLRRSAFPKTQRTVLCSLLQPLLSLHITPILIPVSLDVCRIDTLSFNALPSTASRLSLSRAETPPRFHIRFSVGSAPMPGCLSGVFAADLSYPVQKVAMIRHQAPDYHPNQHQAFHVRRSPHTTVPLQSVFKVPSSKNCDLLCS